LPPGRLFSLTLSSCFPRLLSGRLLGLALGRFLRLPSGRLLGLALSCFPRLAGLLLLPLTHRLFLGSPLGIFLHPARLLLLLSYRLLLSPPLSLRLCPTSLFLLLAHRLLPGPPLGLFLRPEGLLLLLGSPPSLRLHALLLGLLGLHCLLPLRAHCLFGISPLPGCLGHASLLALPLHRLLPAPARRLHRLALPLFGSVAGLLSLLGLFLLPAHRRRLQFLQSATRSGFLKPATPVTGHRSLSSGPHPVGTPNTSTSIPSHLRLRLIGRGPHPRHRAGRPVTGGHPARDLGHRRGSPSAARIRSRLSCPPIGGHR
jgi:hypothetical protein